MVLGVCNEGTHYCATLFAMYRRTMGCVFKNAEIPYRPAEQKYNKPFNQKVVKKPLKHESALWWYTDHSEVAH